MRDDTDAAPATASRRTFLAAAGAAGIATVGGCLGGGSAADDEATAGGGAATTAADPSSGPAPWQSIELDSVRGDEAFTIGGLDAPTIVHSFAVWCPKCERLSNELASVTGSYTVLGLNTDPNEDAETVRAYAEENGFQWRFAVAPPALTDALVAEFGSTAVNAPSTPVVVVCEDGATTFLSGSDSSPSTVESTAEEC